MKQKRRQSFTNERVDIPRVQKDKHGAAILMCPFCTPSHPLRADGAASCGTFLRVQAVQTVYRAKYAKDAVCVKCGKGGGEMVSWQGTALIHAHDCTPGTVTLPEEPKYSKTAEYVYKLPKRVKDALAKTFGYSAMKVDQVDQKGTRTGVILGYTFVKEKKNAKHAQPIPDKPVSS